MVMSLYLALIFALVGQIQSSKLNSGTLGVQDLFLLEFLVAGKLSVSRREKHVSHHNVSRARHDPCSATLRVFVSGQWGRSTRPSTFQ